MSKVENFPEKPENKTPSGEIPVDQPMPKFPKPVTIPEGWNVAEMGALKKGWSEPAEPQYSLAEEADRAKERSHETFPKPKTIPEGWDVSGLNPQNSP